MTGLVFVTGTFFGMGVMLFLMQLLGSSDEPDVEHYRDVRDLVLETYVGPKSEDELLRSALRGMLAELDDYSRYYVEEETDSLDRDTSGKTTGIGVILRYDKAPTIVFPLANSPAQAAGLRVGDELLRLDGQELEGLEADAVSELIQGEEGSSLQIDVRGRDGQTRQVELSRRKLLVPSVRRVRFLDEARGIGYLALIAFSKESLREFDVAVENLQGRGLRGLVIDLRGNRGGVLAAAVSLARRFVPAGIITETEGRGQPNLQLASDDDARYADLPLVLLVDGESASASEVLAGALQDHRLAVLVGTPTYGKGVVQTISRYPARRAIAKLTTSYYYTPAHRTVERSRDDSHAFGLRPDIEVRVTRSERNEVIHFVHSFEPPASVLAELRDWVQETGIEFPLDPPADGQLEAALALFGGELPSSLNHD